MVFYIAVAHQHGFLGKDLGNAVELAHLIGAPSAQRGQKPHQLRIGIAAHGHGGQRDAGFLHGQGDVLEARIGRLPVGEENDMLLRRLGALQHTIGLIQRGIEGRAAIRAQGADLALHIAQAAHTLEGHHPFGRIVKSDYADVVALAQHLQGAHGGLLGRLNARGPELSAGHAARFVDADHQRQGRHALLVAHVDADRQKRFEGRAPVAAQSVAGIAAQHQQTASQRAHGLIQRLPLLLRGILIFDVVENHRIVGQITLSAGGHGDGADALHLHAGCGEQLLRRAGFLHQQHVRRAQDARVGGEVVVLALRILPADQTRLIGDHAGLLRRERKGIAVLARLKRYLAGIGGLAVLIQHQRGHHVRIRVDGHRKGHSLSLVHLGRSRQLTDLRIRSGGRLQRQHVHAHARGGHQVHRGSGQRRLAVADHGHAAVAAAWQQG